MATFAVLGSVLGMLSGVSDAAGVAAATLVCATPGFVTGEVFMRREPRTHTVAGGRGWSSPVVTADFGIGAIVAIATGSVLAGTIVLVGIVLAGLVWRR